MSDRRPPRRPRNVQPDEANLDDLFEPYQPPSQPSVPTREERPWLVRNALQAFAASAVVYAGFHVGGLAPVYPLILAVCLGVVLVRQAVALTAEPPTQRVADAVRAAAAAQHGIDLGTGYEGDDGMLDTIRRWDRRLNWGAGEPERFASTVLVRLGELADERLRLRHGITRTTDPVRARRLLGDQLWAMLHEPFGRVLKPREIAAASDRLESL